MGEPPTGSAALRADVELLLHEQIEVLRAMQARLRRHVEHDELDDANLRDAAAVTRAIQGASSELRQLRKAEAAIDRMRVDSDRVLAYLRQLPQDEREDLVREAGLHDGRGLLG